MADYPDWVVKHKIKGTYINVVKGKYYLYAAHSERVPGTKRVKRICDGYLGRITEEDGLIPPKDKVKEGILVYEYGFSSTILSVCSMIHRGLRKSFVKNGDFVMVASILSYMYGAYNKEIYSFSYLSFRFPHLDFSQQLTKEQKIGTERGLRMITDTMERTFQSDLLMVRIHFSQVYKVKVNGNLHLSQLTDAINQLKSSYHITWED